MTDQQDSHCRPWNRAASVAKMRLMQYRRSRLAACVYTRTIQVSRRAFATLDISAAAAPTSRLNLHTSTAEKACTCEETLRLQHSDGRSEICQSAGFSPSSFREIRGLCDLNTVCRMGLRTNMRQITGLLFHLRLLAQQGLLRDCLCTANILVSGRVVHAKLCLKSNLEYRKHSYVRDFGKVLKQTFNQTLLLVDCVGDWATLC